MYSKTEIYNLALSHLKLSRQVEETETDTVTNEVRVLNQFWDIALKNTLQELDLDSLSQPIVLELLEVLNDGGPWDFIYKYPSKAVFLRRIQSCARVDNASTAIKKRTALYNGQKVIYTTEQNAVGEFIMSDAPLDALSPMAGLAISYNLAWLSAPLIVGKGAGKLQESLFVQYNLTRAKAQEIDANENFNYDEAYERSEYVNVRMS